MAISAVLPIVTYPGDGTSYQFPVKHGSAPIRFYDKSHIRVSLISGGREQRLVLGRDYDLDGGPDAGLVSLRNFRPVIGSSIIVWRETPVIQTLTLTNLLTFSSSAIVEAFDKIVMMIQDVMARLWRTPMLPIAQLGIAGFVAIDSSGNYYVAQQLPAATTLASVVLIGADGAPVPFIVAPEAAIPVDINFSPLPLAPPPLPNLPQIQIGDATP